MPGRRQGEQSQAPLTASRGCQNGKRRGAALRGREAGNSLVRFLKDTDFLQIGFGQLPPNSQSTKGSVIITLNGVVRLEIVVPAQKMDNDRIFVRDLSEFKVSLQ